MGGSIGRAVVGPVAGEPLLITPPRVHENPAFNTDTSMLSRRTFLALMGMTLLPVTRAWGAMTDRVISVSLGQAHRGTLEIDTMLLDSYGKLPEHVRQFYFESRAVFANNPEADFTDPAVVGAARKHGIALMGGPMLGDLKSDGVTVWLRPASAEAVTVAVAPRGKAAKRTFSATPDKPGAEVRIGLTGLLPDTDYDYQVSLKGAGVASGRFTTAPRTTDRGVFRLAFGTCFHKIGLHNPNLMREVLKRNPHAMLLYGDLAVDDREVKVNMHRADYQLRDVSKAWRELAANVPLYTSWDDHDYLNNDLGGLPPHKNFTEQDRDNVRAVWHQNWNNPPAEAGREGIYFSTRIGPVEVIMLDTRSCRDSRIRRQPGAFLGQPQLDWLKTTLKQSTAPFKVITSGTMWSDYISNGKDSWGTWDTQTREELFTMIGEQNIGGVLLLSGDRHGARAFRIPRETGYDLLEFEPATLAGVSGPSALARNGREHQLFGHGGGGLVAFGEFTFETAGDSPGVTFRLIRETGDIMEEHTFPLARLGG